MIIAVDRVAAIVALIAGLALAVIATFFGIERRRGKQIKRPNPAFNLPAAGAALFAFGLIGYLVLQFASAGLAWSFGAGVLAAGLAWLGASALLARWALRAPPDESHELAELLHGHVAVVVRAIGVTAPGAITYRLHGESHTVPARGSDGREIPERTEVVIERIEGGTAYVEPWSLVERRL